MRILENFNKVDSLQNRSRSSLKPDISLRQYAHSPLKKEESEIIQRNTSTRRNIEPVEQRLNNEESIIYSSANIKEAQLPSLSQRKLNRQNESYRAYEDNTADFENIASMKSRTKNNHELKTNTSLQDKILFRNYQNESNLR